MSIWKNIITVLFLLGVLLMLNACVVARTPGHYHEPPIHDAQVYWFYYPDYQVYYHSVDHYYYYLDGTVWIRATTLPPRFVLRDSRRVRIGVTGLPYVRHSHHLRRYPPVRANHRDRRDRRDYRDRFDEERHDSDNNHRHRTESESKKERTNMFLPHTKDRQIKRIERDKKVYQEEKPERRIKAEKSQKIKKKKVVEKEKVRHKEKRGNGRYEKRSKDGDDDEQDNVRKQKSDKSNRYFDR